MYALFFIVATLTACSENTPLFCDGIDCSGHGTCFENGDSFLCVCEENYVPQGPYCVLEEGDADIDYESSADADPDDDADNDPDQNNGDADPDVELPRCTTRFIGKNSNSSGVRTVGLAFADLTGDGFEDAIIGNIDLEADGEIDGVSVFENHSRDGERRFGRRERYLLEPGDVLSAVDVGNLDADADPEIISFVSRPDSRISPGQLHIINNAYTIEKNAVTLDVNYGLTFGALVDLDGDLFTDIVALSWEESSAESQILAWQRTNLAIPESPTSVLALGKRQTGKLLAIDVPSKVGSELVVTSSDGLVLVTYESDKFFEVDELDLDDPPLDLAAADVDNDGLIDLFLVTDAGELHQIEISSAPAFSEPLLIDDSYQFSAVTTADIDGDHDIDLISYDEEVLIVFCNQDGELFFHDEFSHPIKFLRDSMIETVRIDENESPDVAVAAHSLVTYYNE